MTQCITSSKNNCNAHSLCEYLYCFCIISIACIAVVAPLLDIIGLFTIEHFHFQLIVCFSGVVIYFLYAQKKLIIQWRSSLIDTIFITASYMSVLFFLKFDAHAFYWHSRIDDWAHYRFCKDIMSGSTSTVFYIPGTHFITAITSYLSKIHIFGVCNIFPFFVLLLFCCAIYFLVTQFKPPLYAFFCILCFAGVNAFADRILLFIPENIALVFFISVIYFLSKKSSFFNSIATFLCCCAMLLCHLSYLTLFACAGIILYFFVSQKRYIIIAVPITVIFPIIHFFYKNKDFISTSPDRLNPFESIVSLIAITVIFILCSIFYKKIHQQNHLIVLAVVMTLSFFYMIAAYIPQLLKLVSYGPRLTYIDRFELYYYMSALLFLCLCIPDPIPEKYMKKSIFFAVCIVMINTSTIKKTTVYIQNCIHLNEYMPNSVVQSMNTMSGYTVITNWPDINIVRGLTSLKCIDGLAGYNAQIATHVPFKYHSFRSFDIMNMSAESLHAAVQNIHAPIFYLSPNIMLSYKTYARLQQFVNSNQDQECLQFYSFSKAKDPKACYKKLLDLFSDSRYFSLIAFDAFTQTALYAPKIIDQ